LNNHLPVQIIDYFGNPECTIVLPIMHTVDPEAVPPQISLIDYLTVSSKDLSMRRLWIWEVVSVKVHTLFELVLMNYCPLATIVDEQIRPACTVGAVIAAELLFERIVRPTDPGSPPTQASDIWSLACTIYEPMFGTGLFFLRIGTRSWVG
jgi:serine/threonine-protein kinase SRPK3